MQVGPEQLAQFTDAQAGVNGRKVDEPSLRSRDGKQPLQLVRRDGAAFGLASTQVDLGDVFERIDGESALALEPVEEGVGEVEIFVERLRGQVFLLAAPGGEGIGREIIQPREAAFIDKLHHAGLHNFLIMRAAAKRFQIREEIVQMRERGLSEGVAFLRRQGQPGFLALLVLDDGQQFGMRSLLVSGVERHVFNVELTGEAEASAIGALDDDFAALAAFGFIDVGNHTGRWDFKRWM